MENSFNNEPVLGYIKERYGVDLKKHLEVEGGYVAFISADGESSKAYGCLTREEPTFRLHMLRREVDETFELIAGAGMAFWMFNPETGEVKVGLVKNGNPVTVKGGWVQAEFIMPPDKGVGTTNIEDEFSLVMMTVTPPYQDDMNESWVGKESILFKKLNQEQKNALENALNGELDDLLKMVR